MYSVVISKYSALICEILKCKDINVSNITADYLDITTEYI